MTSLHRLQFKSSTMCGTGKLEQEALVDVGLGDVDNVKTCQNGSLRGLANLKSHKSDDLTQRKNKYLVNSA